MATINIRRDVADPFYRYKMERIMSKIEGKGNGIKSVIVNLSSIAHSLSRDPACKSTVRWVMVRIKTDWAF
jgi:translation initiation factor 5